MGLFDKLSSYKKFVDECDRGQYINRFNDDITELYQMIGTVYLKEFLDEDLITIESYGRELYHSKYSLYEVNDLKLIFFNGMTITFERFTLNSISDYRGGFRICAPWKGNKHITIIREYDYENKVVWRNGDYPPLPLSKETFLDLLEKLLL